MGATITDPDRLILTDAADLIAARGWDRLADPYAADGSGALSVRSALECATDARDWGSFGATRAVTSDDGMSALAAYLIDTVMVPVPSVWFQPVRRACSAVSTGTDQSR